MIMSTNNDDCVPFTSFISSHSNGDVDGGGGGDVEEHGMSTVHETQSNLTTAVLEAAVVESLEMQTCKLLPLCKKGAFDVNDFSQATAEASLQLLFDMMRNAKAAIAEAAEASNSWGKEATEDDDDESKDEDKDTDTDESEEMEEAQDTLCPFSLEESMILATLEAMRLVGTLDYKIYLVRCHVARTKPRKCTNTARRLIAHARSLWWESKVATWNEMVENLELHCQVVRWQRLLLSLHRSDPESRSISCVKYNYCGFNEMDYPDFDMNEFKVPNDSGCAQSLGQALLPNTVVSTLRFELGTLLSPGRRNALLSNDQEDGEAIKVPMEMDALLTFLQTSTSMQCIILDKHYNDDLPEPVERALGDWFLKAIASKSSHIDKLVLRLRHFSSVEFRNVMKTRPIRELEVSFDKLVLANAVDPEQDDITVGIAGNQTLTSLTIASWPQDRALTENILSSLPCLGRTLQVLRVEARTHNSGNFFHDMQRSCSVLSQYLVMTVGTLQSLTLECFEFREADIVTLLSSLVHSPACTNSGVQSVSLVELNLMSCWFDRGAERQLATFLQNRATSGNDGSSETMVCNSSLRKLRIGGDGDDECMCPSLSRRVAESLLMATPPVSTDARSVIRDRAGVEPPCRMYATIGSQIHSLTMNLEYDRTRFFRILSGNARRVVHLRELQLQCLSRETCKEFARCFPKLTSVRHLTLKDVQTSGDILRGLKRNSSVQQVTTFDRNSEYECDFDPKQLRLIQALCERNKFLAATCNTEPADSACQTRCCAQSDGSDGGSSSKSSAIDKAKSMEKAELTIVPSLLKVAQQTPETCSAIVMRGLLMLNQRVGGKARGSIRCHS